MNNYFKKLEMTAESYIVGTSQQYKIGDRIILEFSKGDILLNNGVTKDNSFPKLTNIEKCEVKNTIEDYYENFKIPLEAIITNIKVIEKDSNSHCKLKFYISVYFPSTKDGHLLSWKCDSCGTENKAIYCRHCGKKRTLPIDYWICPKCNEPVKNEDNFCGICGSANPNRKDSNTISSPDSPPKNANTVHNSNIDINVKYTPNLHTAANSITKGKNSKACTELFEQAIKLKRNGSFTLAIEKEKHAIKIYPDSPDLSQMFMGLGKLYYLAGLFNKCQYVYALSIYRTFNNPSNILYGQPSPAYELSAIHYGHALMDKNIQNTSINNYKSAIMGKTIGMPQLSDYDDMCIAKGMEFVRELYEKYRSGRAEAEYKTLYNKIIGQ